MLQGGAVGPQSIVVSVLAVVNPASRLIPPASVVTFLDASASADREVLPYAGDRGVALQHVGALVGAGAHTGRWPQIRDWLRARAAI